MTDFRLMSLVTSLLYGALCVYMGGWYIGRWTGNFSLLLFLLSVVTGAYWLAERFKFRPEREAAADRFEQEDAARRAKLGRQGIDFIDSPVTDETREALLRQPWWLDWTAGLFPVIVTVFLVRSFVVEPFKIPSGSMIPTLEVGDLILVNKFRYGIRLPVLNQKIVPNHDPIRGDVVVFRYPVNPSLDYIKRVVGVPGDVVSYQDAVLSINGTPVPTTAQGEGFDDESQRYMARFTEDFGTNVHRVQRYPQVLPFNEQAVQPAFRFRDRCTYNLKGFTCTVPMGHYFVMGDNRDNSEDSRYWGFVPDENLVGKAFFVWMNFRNPGRIGPFK
jgi:signal peptidase I